MSPELLAVVAPHGIESTPFAGAHVLGVVLALAAISLGLGRYYERIQRELMKISRALRASPPRWHEGVPGVGRPALLADAPTAVVWVDGFDAQGVQSIIAVGQTFQDAFSQIIFASVHAFDVTDSERAAEAEQFRSSLETSIARYAQMASLYGMAVGSKVVLGPDVRALGEQVADDLVRTYPRAIFFVPKLAITPSRWYHRLLGPLVSPSLVRRLRLRGVVTHEVLLPVGVGPSVTRARLKSA